MYNDNQKLKDLREELLKIKRFPQNANVNLFYSDYVTDAELKLQIQALENSEDKTTEEIEAEKKELRLASEKRMSEKTELSNFKKGSKVEHATFGIGIVTEVKNGKITVGFAEKTAKFLVGYTDCLKTV